MSQIPMQFIVDFLGRRNPAALPELRARYPNQQNFLEPGKHLGDATISPSTELLNDLAAVSIVEASSEGNQLSQKIRRKLLISARLRLAGSLSSAISAAGIIGALVVGARQVAMMTAIISFASATFTLLAQYTEDFVGGRKSLREMRDKVAEQSAEIFSVDAEFKLMRARRDFSAIEEMIRRLNVSMASMRQIELALG